MPEIDEFDPDHPDNKPEAPPVPTDTEERAWLEIRKGAYRRVFEAGVPSADDRRIVMDDLRQYCRGERTPWNDNERIHCALTGRHEVYTRISNHLRLTVDALVEEYASTPQTGET